MAEEDRLAALEARIADLEQTVTDMSARGSGTSHVFGRNPLVEKYAALGSQVFATLKAGQVFNDTLGKFFPVTISRTGGITINTSPNHVAGLTLHDAANGGTDTLLTLFGAQQLALIPNTTDTAISFLIVNDNRVLSYNRGFVLVSGTSTAGQNPRISAIESTGTRTIYKQTHIVRVKAGAPVDGDYDTPTDGMIVVDSSNNRIYARHGGAWHFAALT